MAYIALRQFGGMSPRYGKQQLPEIASEVTSNALLLSGELRGIRGKQIIEDLRSVPYDIKRVYRALYATGATEWVTFDDETVDFEKGPLINDSFERYYWTSENTRPMMNTLDRIASGNTGFILGVPRPVNIPVVTPDDSGTSDTGATRAYVYTFVSAYGEEGAPSEAGIAYGKEDDVWVISNMDTTVPDAAERNITRKFLYRTVSSATGGIAYHFVAEIPLTQDTFSDDIATDVVAGNNTLESTYYDEPPTEMEGLIAHPNGFFIAFHGRDIFFSEPYKPHAWPSHYRLSTQDPIKGFGIFQTSLVVGTQGYPYICTGITPSGVTFTKAQTAEPCLSTRRGIVSMPFGVYYPSDNGLFLVSPAGFAVATTQLITKVEWQRDYAPWNLTGVRWQNQYVGFYDPDDGLMFSPEERNSAVVNLDDIWTHDVLQQDLFSGDVWMVEDNIVYEWNPAFGIVQPYKWKSKEFVTPKPVNFSAFACEADLEPPPEIGPEYQEFNDIRFNYPLNPLNFAPVGAVRRMETIPGFTPPLPIKPETKQPSHESPLFRTLVPYEVSVSRSSPTILEMNARNITAQATNPVETYNYGLWARIYADGDLVHEVQVEDQETYRIPGGYKARRWQFEFIGTVRLKSFKIAETAKELERV